MGNPDVLSIKNMIKITDCLVWKIKIFILKNTANIDIVELREYKITGVFCVIRAGKCLYSRYLISRNVCGFWFLYKGQRHLVDICEKYFWGGSDTEKEKTFFQP